MDKPIKLSRTLIIADDAELAERVCSRLRAPRTYVVTIEAPKERLVQYGVYERDCIRVGNAVEAVDPDCVLFLGCSESARRSIRPHFDQSRRTVVLNAFDEGTLKGLPGLRSNAVSPAIWDGATSTARLVIVEETNTVARIIAENLAVSESAQLYGLPTPASELTDRCADSLRDWAELGGAEREEAKSKLLGTIRSRTGALADASPKSISFFTHGIPYGIYPFRCPTTHFFSKHLVGISVVSGILKSSMRKLRCPVAVLIDPGLTEKSEFDSLRQVFGKSGYLIRRALGENASVTKSRYLTEYMPCDYIFYSTHCGERKGRRITELFTTANGREHEITYDVLRDAAASPTPGIVEVHNFYRFVSLDGVDWTDSEGKTRIGAGRILEEFIKYSGEIAGDPRKMRIKASTESPLIRASDSLAMCDGTWRPMPQIVGGYHFPIVFNNACSSWREFALEFGCSGAAAYIGTSLPILDSLAQDVACRFAWSVVSGRAIGPSLYYAQRNFIAENGYAPYLMHGYMFTKLQPPPIRLFIEVMTARRLKMVYDSCAKAAAADSQTEKSKRGWNSVFHFLSDEIESLKRPIRNRLFGDQKSTR
jgi:hypothetical protein